MTDGIEFGLGWIPDHPDIRDYNIEEKQVKVMLEKSKVLKKKENPPNLPKKVDLREWCSMVENQLSLGSCTSHAGVGMVEYYERRAFMEHIDASRLFLYKVTRKLLHWTGDTGAYLRTTMKAMVLFGVPPEEYWAYVVSKFDEEPSAFLYAFAQNYQALKYFRLDPYGVKADQLLSRIKLFLSHGFPSMFGFTVYNSITDAGKDGKIPFPQPGDKVIGGHAVMAVGYDDEMSIGKHEGALIIRNSWGENWGDNGYGYLPYDYALRGLARDWWILLKKEYVDTGNFD